MGCCLSLGNAALLYDACEKGQVDAARLLLDKGADVDRARKDGVTPLWIACLNGHVDVARLLLERGAVVEHDSSALYEGDTVEAKWRGRRYYPGKISRDCGEGKYDIAYDDGDRERGVDARLIRKPSLSPLYIACKNGHVDVVRLLLDKGADVNRAGNTGMTPLFIACQNGHVDAVRLLLERGAVFEHDSSALCEGDTVEVRYRGRKKYYPGKIRSDCGEGKYDIAYDDGDEETGVDARLIRKPSLSPLYIACKNGHVDVVRLLLDKGAEVDRACGDDKTPLYIACENGHGDAARLLLEKGADVNQADKDGATPLHIACFKGHVDAARLLLEKGAEVDRADTEGWTPLLTACDGGHVDAARLLLEKGADVNKADKDATTPLFVACQNGNVALAPPPIPPRSPGGTVTLADGTVIHSSMAPALPPRDLPPVPSASGDLLGLLLENGAEVNRADKHGRTPLFIACVKGHVDAARLLLDKGAEVDRATESGNTPLAIAKQEGHSALVALLVESRPPLPLGPPRPQRQQSDIQCSICLGPYVERAWTKCNHSFCRECITEVCRTNPPTNRAPCPFCRQPVLLGELTRRPRGI